MSFRFKVACLPLALALFFVLFAGAAHAQSDTTPPSLVSVSFEPAQVDTSNGPATITVTVHVTDDLSGLDTLQLDFYHLMPMQHCGVFVNAINALKSGIDRDGYFVATMTLPRYSAYGEWKLMAFSLTDHVGNVAAASPEWRASHDLFGFGNGPVLTPTSNHLFLPALSSL